MLSSFYRLVARIWAVFHSRDLYGELDAELKSHLELRREDLMRGGMSADEARRMAHIELGGVTQLHEAHRETRSVPLVGNLVMDIRYQLRQLRKSPLFALAAVLTLAIGIGANTAIFSLVDQVILRLLPVQDPQRIVALVGTGKFYGDSRGTNPISYPMYERIRDRNPVFSLTMCRVPQTFTVGTSSGNEIVGGELVSGNYFPLLGIQPAAGRLFSAEDTLHSGANPYVVLSYGYWQSHFPGDRDIVGRTIRIDNYPFTVIGIAQSGFNGLEPGLNTGIFVPVTMLPVILPDYEPASHLFDPRERWVNVYARLRPGLTIAQAKAGLQPLFHQLLVKEVGEPGFAHATAYQREQYVKMQLDVIPGGQGNSLLRQQFEKPLALLMGVSGLVLLISCANIAGLLLARATARQREIAVRLAIGSSRLRIAQQLVTESLVLAVAGGAAAIGVALAIVKGLLAFLPSGTDYVRSYNLSSTPDSRMLAFSMSLALLTGIAFGLVPALRATRPDLAKALKDRYAAAGAGRCRFRKALIAGQVALSLILLTGASLFIRSLQNLRSLNPGFQAHNVVQFSLDLPAMGYDQTQRRAFFRALEERLVTIPGVESAGTADVPLLSGNRWIAPMLVIAGYQAKPGEDMTGYVNAVSPGYFQTLGIRLIAGRVFRASDTATSQPVAVVNESFVRRFFANQPVVGHFVGKGEDPSAPTDIQIVGVVSDADYESLRPAAPRQIYLCVAQHLPDIVYIRTKQDPRSLFPSIRKLVHEMEPRVAIQGMKTLEQQVNESLVTERMVASLSSGFSLIATALAMIGLYGVLAYMVTQRAREMAIRIALGARAGRVLWLIIREVVAVLAIGMGAALPLLFVLNRFVRSQLYGIPSNDVGSIAVAAVVLSVVALLAGYLPARRAASYDPMQTLRYE